MVTAMLLACAVAAAPKALPNGDPVVSPDGSKVYWADKDGSLAVYDAKSLKLREEWKGALAKGDAFVSPSRSGKWLVVWYRDGSAAVHDASTGAKKVTLNGKAKVRLAKPSDDDERVFAMGDTERADHGHLMSVLTFERASGKLLKEEPLGAGGTVLELDGSGTRLISQSGGPSKPDVISAVRADGTRVELGRGFPGIRSLAGEVVVFHIGPFGEAADQITSISWVDLRRPAERVEIAVGQYSQALLSADGTRMLVNEPSSVVSLWNITDPKHAESITQRPCSVTRAPADLSFALCCEWQPPKRVDLSP